MRQEVNEITNTYISGQQDIIVNKVCNTNLVGQYETSGQWNHLYLHKCSKGQNNQ